MDTQTKTIFHRGNTSYNTGVAMQHMQHSSGGTVQYWQRTQFQILVNLPKWYIQVFLVKMVAEVLITLTQKINDCMQETVMKILAIRMVNHPLYFTLYFILSVLSLPPQPSANHYQCTVFKALLLKQRKRIPSWARTWIIVVQFESLTDTLIDWLYSETIDIYESPIDTIIFSELSSPNFCPFTQKF